MEYAGGALSSISCIICSPCIIDSVVQVRAMVEEIEESGRRKTEVLDTPFVDC